MDDDWSVVGCIAVVDNVVLVVGVTEFGVRPPVDCKSAMVVVESRPLVG